jgi:hypothetical protein
LRCRVGLFCKLLLHPIGQFNIYLPTLACSPKSLKRFAWTVRSNILLDAHGMRLTIEVYGALESAFGNRRDIQTGQFETPLLSSAQQIRQFMLLDVVRTKKVSAKQ